MINREIPFRPRLEGEFRVRFYNAASEITEKTPTLTIARIAEREIEWVEKDCQYNIEQRKKYRAVWFLFRDLIRASWKACYRNGVIYMSLPTLNGTDIKRLLDEAEDPISLLFEPVSESSLQIFEKSRHEDLPAFKSQNEAVKWYLKGLNESGLCLMDNLKRHPNPLTQLRLFNFFCIFHLVRYMALLEAFYCGENIRPVLLDFSGIAPSQSSVARASEMAYTQMHKSINRFYAWGYAQKLKEKEFMKCIEKGMTYCAFSIRLHEQTPELYAKIKITI